MTASWEAADDGGSVVTRYRVQWRAGRRRVRGFGFPGHGRRGGLRAAGSRVSPMARSTGFGCGRRTGWVTDRGRRLRRLWRRPFRARPAALSPGRGDRSISVTWQAPSASWRSGDHGVQGAVAGRWTRLTDEASRQADRDRPRDRSDTRDHGSGQRDEVLRAGHCGPTMPATAQRPRKGPRRRRPFPEPRDDVTLETRDRSLGVSWEAAADGGSVVTRLHGAVASRATTSSKDSDSQVTVGGGVFEPPDHGSHQWHRILGAGPGGQQRG